MDEPSSSSPLSPSDEATAQYKLGMELKSKGQTDAALTSFRRAIIIDPKFFAAQFETGLLCREKAKRDKIFLRNAFEAFRQAARLDLQHEDAHNHYIMAGQQTGVLDSLLLEYREWARQYPDNELMQKCSKNILALSLAMMPQKVTVGAGSSSRSIRKFIFITSCVTLLSGAVFFISPPFLLKAGKIKKEQVSGLVRLGFLLSAVGIGGFVLRSQID